MNPDFRSCVFACTPYVEQRPGAAIKVCPVVIVGAEPVGLAIAIDLV